MVALPVRSSPSSGVSSVDPRDRYLGSAGLDRANKVDADVVVLTSQRRLFVRPNGPRLLAEAPAEECKLRWYRTSGRFLQFAYLHFDLPEGKFYWATSQLRTFGIPSRGARRRVEVMIEGIGVRAEAFDPALLSPTRAGGPQAISIRPPACRLV